MIRRLVPALAILASGVFAVEPTPPAVPAVAPETKHEDSLTIGGYIDTTYGTTWSRSAHNSVFDGQLSTFNAEAKLKIGYTITDKVQADLGLFFVNAQNSVDLNTAKIAYAYSDKTTITIGKMINNVGWQAAEAPGLWRVNYNPLLAYYHSNWTGVNFNHKLTSEVTADFAVYNGWAQPYTGQHLNQTASDKQRPQDMGYGLDLTWAKDTTAVNYELYYAPNNAFVANVGPQTQPGNLLQMGLNFTAKSGDITLGGELIWQHLTPQTVGGEPPVSNINSSKQDDIAWMLAAKSDISAGTVSAMFSQVYKDIYTAQDDQGKGFIDGLATTNASSPANVSELALCLSTTPVGSPSFAVNYEVAYKWFGTRTVGSTLTESKNDAVTLTLEVLAVIP